MSLTRRSFLKRAAGAALWAALPPFLPLGLAGTAQARTNVLARPGRSGLYGQCAPSGPLTLTARPVSGLLPGRPKAPLLVYQTVHNGATLYNPVLRLRQGQEFRADLVNGLDQPTIIHWHGLDAPWTQAGHPLHAVPPGGTHATAFPVTSRAGTYWYHPHPHGLTAPQTYLGLASFFLVEDQEERALAAELDPRPEEADLPLLLQDKRFDSAGRLLYAPSPGELAMGYQGPDILVNGVADAVLDTPPRILRLRLLNGCNARLFHLGLAASGRPVPMVLAATDAGLLAAPVPVERLFLSPGERVEILVDLTRAKPGTEVVLGNLPFDPMHREEGLPGHGDSLDHGQHGEAEPGHGQASGHGAADAGGHGSGHAAASPGPAPRQVPEGAAYPLLRIRVREGASTGRRIPERLASLPQAPAPPDLVRDFALAVTGGRWTMNGLTFAMDQAPVVVEKRGLELWRFVNADQSMPHPMHVHGYLFRVLSRRGSPAQVQDLAVTQAGLTATDLGFKDTVLVWPGETVDVALDFSRPDYAGEQTFLVHCHNLEHEDQGMMLNFKVK